MQEEKMECIVKLPDGSTVLVEQQKKEIREEIIGQLIELRKQRKMTQQDITNATGIQRPNVARIESKKATPSMDILVRMAAAVGKRIVITLEDIEPANK